MLKARIDISVDVGKSFPVLRLIESVKTGLALLIDFGISW